MQRVILGASLALLVGCSAAPPVDDAGTGGGTTGGGGGSAQGGGAGGGEGPDTTPPEVLATVPSDHMTGIQNSTVLQVLFTEPMNPASVTLAVAPAVQLGAPTWNAEGSLATWTPQAVLALSTTYVASVNGADEAGNALAQPHSFTFSTGAAPDTTAPELESSTPAAGATTVATSTRLRLTFNEAMATGSVVVATTPPVAQGPGTWTNGDRTVTFAAPASPWSAGTAYTVALTGQDLAGNALAADAGLAFTTSTAADTTPPRLLASTPDAGATGVGTGTRLSLTFSEAMATSSVSVATTPVVALGLPTWGNANRTVTFGTPGADWAAATTYAVRVAGRDPSNNALAADAGFTFTTAIVRDTTPPTVVSTSPVNGATSVPASAPLRLTFSEPMATAATQSAITLSNSLFSCAWVWSLSDTVATCTPPLGWTAGTVTVRVGTGARDKAGNFLAAEYRFAFSTP